MNLLDLLHKADVISVDRVLCSNFGIDGEATEMEDIALEVSYEEDGNIYEHFISVEQLNHARQHRDGSWSVMTNNGDWDECSTIKPYKLTELK